jgi:glycosyltransferase involved in cell wall biosynthesis
MPKVLRIINRFNLGGPTYNAAYLTKYLSPEFKTVLVGGLPEESEGSSDFILNSIGVKPIIIPEMRRSIHYNNDITAYYKIKNIISRYKPDIVHTHASKAGSLGRLAAHRCGVPVIVHTFHGHVFHSYFGKTKTSIYKQIERRLATFSTKIIAISDIQKYELGEVHKICPTDKIEVVPLGFDLSRFEENRDFKRIEFRNKYGISKDQVAVGIIGRLVPVKNHRLFIDAFAALYNEMGDKVRGFIVGDGELKDELVRYSESQGLKVGFGNQPGECLTFTSWEKEVDVVNAGLDVIALSSLNEGTPVSLIEAQASGKAVVSTNVGGIEDVVKNGRTGLLCEKHETNKFTEHLITLCRSEEIRKEMGEAGNSYVRHRYHYDRLVNDMRTLYGQLLTAHSKTKSTGKSVPV